jgi:hypothetical protein
MGDALMGNAMVGEKSRLDIARMTVPGDSPIARAIQRRQWEITHSEEVVVTHDSMI